MANSRVRATTRAEISAAVNGLPSRAVVGFVQIAAAGAGLPAAFAALLADSDAQAARGALFDDGRALSRLIGRPTTPLAETIRAALKA